MTHSRSPFHWAAVCVMMALLCTTALDVHAVQEMAGTRCGVVDSSMEEGSRSTAEQVGEVHALLDAWRDAPREGDVEALAVLVKGKFSDNWIHTDG